MKKIIQEIKQNKLLLILTILTIISILLGILFPAILSKSNKELITSSIKDFIDAISKNNINYLSGLISSLTNNILITILIWILGISLIGIPFLLIIILFKGFLTGFSFSSILVTYGIKGIITAIVYTIPNILNLLGSFLLGYYAISFSIALYKSVFKKELRNWNLIIKRYLKIGLIFLLFSIAISLLETFALPKILNFL